MYVLTVYQGWPHRRVRGDTYDIFIDKWVYALVILGSYLTISPRFVQLVRKYHPHSLLHFEDFGVTNAYRLLGKYHDTHAVFNDDV